jgi:hypothetical protein
LEDANEQADRLWGTDRISAMEDANDQLREEISLYKTRQKQIDKWLEKDKTTLNSSASKIGVSLEYDEDGDIINYNKEMAKFDTRRQNLIDSFGATIDESEQEQIDQLDEDKEQFDEDYKQYESTKTESDTNKSTITDLENEEKENNYEIFTQKIEYKIDVDDRELTELDFKLKVIEDDFFSMGEAMALLEGKMDTSLNSLETYGQSQAEIDKLLEEGKIDQVDWAEYTK